MMFTTRPRLLEAAEYTDSSAFSYIEGKVHNKLVDTVALFPEACYMRGWCAL